MTGRWAFELRAGSDEEAALWPTVSDLPSATSRRVSLSLTQPSSVSLTMHGEDADAVLVEELRSDVVAVRDGVALARGRVVGTSDNISASGYSVSVSCADYRELLKRRIMYDADPELLAWSSTVPNPAVDQETIAWGLIERSQSRTGGNWGITRASSATGVLRNRTYEAGSVVGDLIENLSKVEDGFEWSIDPDLAFQLYYPQRGGETDFLLEWGGAVESVQRSVTSGNFANAVRLNGAPAQDGSTPPEVATAESVTIGIEGAWEVQLGDTGAIEADTVAERAAYELSNRELIVPSYSLQLNTSIWKGPGDLWLGDSARLVIKTGRLDVDVMIRVLGFDFDIDNDGYERVTLTAGALTQSQTYYQRQRELARRLSELERR